MNDASRPGPDDVGAHVRGYVAASPYNAALGTAVVSLEGDGCVLELPWQARLCADGTHGPMHAGALTALVDAGFGLAVLKRFAAPRPMATLDLRIEHLAAAEPGRPLRAELVRHRLDGQFAFVRGVVHQGVPEAPVAAASGIFMLLNAGSPAATEAAAPPGEAPAPAPAPMPRALERLVDAVPFAGFLGLRLDVDADGSLVATMPWRPELVGNVRYRRMHGGAIAGLMQCAATVWLARERGAETGQRPVAGVVDFLRPGAPRATFARVSPVKVGGQIARLRVDAWQETPQRPIATLAGSWEIG